MILYTLEIQSGNYLEKQNVMQRCVMFEDWNRNSCMHSIRSGAHLQHVITSTDMLEVLQISK